MNQLTKHQKNVRARVLYMAGWMIAHEWIEGYSEARPYSRPSWPPTKPFANDCSGTLKLLFEWAGVPSPDGEPWGYGNTQTLVDANRAYKVSLDPKKWQPMDYVFYKRHPGWFRGGPSEHVAMLTYKDKYGRWHAISHGGNSGPKDVLAHYRTPVAVRRYRIPLFG